MEKFWKKTGWFSLCVLALAACMVLQVGLGALCMLPATFSAAAQAARMGITDFEELQAYIYQAAMSAAPLGVFAYHIVSIPLFALWMYFGCGRKKEGSIARVFTAKRVIVAVVCGLGLCIFANGFVMAGQYLFPAAIEQYNQLMENAQMGTSIFTIIASVLLAPVGEEILCRGIIFHYAKRLTEGMKNSTAAFWIANAVQALMFGIMHGNMVQGSYAFLLGLGLGWLRHKYNSLYPAMLGHFVVNFSSLFLIGALLGAVPEGFLPSIGVLMAGAVIVWLSVWLGREGAENHADHEAA